MVDNNLPTGANTTTYLYDLVGNIASVTEPNGVVTTYSYNSLNRLTDEVVKNAVGTTLASYSYTLDNAGNRTGVTETQLLPNGTVNTRTVAYQYDNLYRLLSETISGDSQGGNGTVSYTYDLTGNRMSRTSSVAGVSTSTSTYNANDELTSETDAGAITNYSYDANGNTTETSNGTTTTTFTYDSQNRLVKQNAGTSGEIDIVYDGAGNKVSETVNGVTTKYLIDSNNPTGYSQIVEEVVNGVVTRRYTVGHWVISETQNISGTWATSFYGYDGHNSVRFLTNSAGAVTDNYTFDAFGNKIAGAGTTPNQILYSGEFLDPGTGNYDLRARVYNENTGTFLTRDTYAGQNGDPITLHQYLYAGADPVMNLDPTGMYTQGEGFEAHDVISERYEASHRSNDVEYGQLLQKLGIKPDILDYTADTFYEIKPLTLSGIAGGVAQMAAYTFALAPGGFSAGTWQPRNHVIYIGTVKAVFFNLGGILFYTDVVDQLDNLLEISTIGFLISAVRANPKFLESALDILGDRLPGLVARGVVASGEGATIEAIDMDIAAVAIEAI